MRHRLLRTTRLVRPRATAVLVGLGAAALACDVDDSVIYPPTAGQPTEVRPGIFRLTYHLEPDLYPIWIDSVTVSSGSRNLPPYDTGFVVLQRSIRGGRSTEREPVFRQQAPDLVLRPVSAPVVSGQSFLVLWHEAKNDVDACSLPCPSPAPRGVRVVFTGDGVADTLPDLPGWSLLFDRISETIAGPFGQDRLVRIRLVPEDVDARDRLANPFGPAFAPATREVFVSSGTAIFRATGDPGSPAIDSVTAGSYPAASPDGRLLAFSRTTLADSAVTTCSIFLGIGSCVQTTVTIEEAGRTVWVRDLTTDTEQSLGEGWAPAFDDTGTRIVVATVGGLTWVDVATAARTPIANTAGAHSPSVSPDGGHLAFVAEWSGQPDVYFMAIPRP